MFCLVADWQANVREQPGAEIEIRFQLVYTSEMTLDQSYAGQSTVIQSVGGEQSFRRRLLELGLLPGTRVTVLRVAPLGDPIELSARGTNLSIRKREAREVRVSAGDSI